MTARSTPAESFSVYRSQCSEMLKMLIVRAAAEAASAAAPVHSAKSAHRLVILKQLRTPSVKKTWR